jgi:hypothetical protein
MDKSTNTKGIISEYARYCLRSIEILYNSNKDVGKALTIQQLEAFQERPPILLSLETIDGHVFAEHVPMPPYLKAEELLKQCSEWLSLKDPRWTTLGIFVYDTTTSNNNNNNNNNISSKNINSLDLSQIPLSPRYLFPEEYIGDVYLNMQKLGHEFKLVVKKKLFMDDDNEYISTDENYSKLLYLQAEKEVLIDEISAIHDEETAIYLSSIAIVLAYGQETPTRLEPLLLLNLQDFLPPSYIKLIFHNNNNNNGQVNQINVSPITRENVNNHNNNNNNSSINSNNSNNKKKEII